LKLHININFFLFLEYGQTKSYESFEAKENVKHFLLFIYWID